MDNQLAVDDRIQMGEDIACSLFCLYQSKSIVLIDQCLYHYRQSNSSMKRNSKVDGWERCQVLYGFLKNRAKLFTEEKELLKKIDYILFFELMLSAYSYLLEKKNFLFPFSIVKRGEKIVIFGAGIFGEELYETVRKNGFCQISGWIDNKFEVYQRYGKPVLDPIDIVTMEFDHVVVAITNPDYRKAAIQELQRFGTEAGKIADIDQKILVHEMLPAGLL